MFDLFDLSDHTLKQIATWTEVAVLLFMLWQHYGPRLFGGGVNAATPNLTKRHSASLWENRTIIVAVVGLVIVAWLYWRPESGFEAQKETLITWLKRAQDERGIPHFEFTPASLTLDRSNAFRSAAGSIINASGNLPSTTIQTVAESESGKFANVLVDTFITSGFHIGVDGQGHRVGAPTTRLDPGITIVAPVPSLAAEAIRVGFERIGIQTRRSTRGDGDYLTVEVGPAP